MDSFTVGIVFDLVALAFALGVGIANTITAAEDRQRDLRARRDQKVCEEGERRAARGALKARKTDVALKDADEAFMRHFRAGLSVAKALELANASTEAGVQ